MRSLVVVADRWPERSQTFVANEVREVAARGVPLRLFHLREPLDPGDPAPRLPAERLVDPGAWTRRELLGRLARLVPRWGVGPARALRLLAADRSLGRAAACRPAVDLVERLDHRPVRIHAHFANAPAGVAMFASAITGAPFSFTPHANDLHVRAQDLEAKLARADLVVHVCDYNRDWLARRHPHATRQVVVPCGVDPSAFCRTRPYAHTPFTIVAVGRLVAKKGFDDLLRAAAHLRARGVAFRLTVLGDGPERDALQALRDDLDLAAVVTFEGSCPPARVRDALDAASVLCLPCVVADDGDRDSQPLVVKEAMAMEVPVVGTREVGLPEMVVDGVTGRLVPPRSPEALAEALADLAADAVTAASMGRAARRRVEQQFAFSVTIPRLLEAWGVDG